MGKSGRFASQQRLNFLVLKFTKLKGLHLGINSQYLDTILLRCVVRIQREKRRDSHQISDLRIAVRWVSLSLTYKACRRIVGGKRRTITRHAISHTSVCDSFLTEHRPTRHYSYQQHLPCPTASHLPRLLRFSFMSSSFMVRRSGFAPKRPRVRWMKTI